MIPPELLANGLFVGSCNGICCWLTTCISVSPLKKLLKLTYLWHTFAMLSSGTSGVRPYALHLPSSHAKPCSISTDAGRPAWSKASRFSLASAAVLAATTPRFKSLNTLRARGGDFAIVRFRIPGVDDLTMLPRVITAVCLSLLVYNKSISGEADSFRQVSETLALVCSLIAWSIPWVGGRLEEAARRKVSAKPATRQPGSIQTLAIKQTLPAEVQIDISWISSVMLRLTNADGLVIWHNGQVICSRGILKRLQGFASGAEYVLKGLEAVWQPDATAVDGYCATQRGLSSFPQKLLPEKVLPVDTECAVVKPIPGGGHLVMWSALPRAFDKEADRLWVQNAASKLGLLLNKEEDLQGQQTVAEVCFEDDLPIPLEENDETTARDPFARFDTLIRIAPTIFGVIGLGVLILNRQSLVYSDAS